VGNGMLGAMIFGGMQREHIQFNHKTLWTGSAESLGNYQSFGDIYLAFPYAEEAAEYRRELDLAQAVSRVSYRIGAARFKREYFSSSPDDVIVARFTSSEANKISFVFKLVDSRDGIIAYSGNRASLTGKLTVLSYEAQFLIQSEGGSITSDENGIIVSNANAVTILAAAGTDYDPHSPSYTGTGLSTALTEKINEAASKSYELLLERHRDDYQALFGRVQLSLNEQKPEIPTDELLAGYSAGKLNPALEVLYYQYGRYLLISSSRGLPLPANLQGIWNNSNTPPWQSDIHTNINVQMNYWPSESANLSEMDKPYLDFIYNQAIVQPVWRSTAQSMGARGWTVYTQMNIFGYSDWRLNNPANAWMCMQLWEHYRYTLDRDYLARTAYPVMKSACEFWLDRLVLA
ncbi:glycoside hydrolase N-terminal domain-containing protein, partial [Paenibacillus sepulcri]|nr:glycoside hydrolase N-terminal domain-containing protein [Paenibacillus sepulcri]